MKIVYDGEYYAIERRTYFFWKEYLSTTGSGYWFSDTDSIREFCVTTEVDKICKLFASAEEASRILNFQPVKIPIELIALCSDKKETK